MHKTADTQKPSHVENSILTVCDAIPVERTPSNQKNGSEMWDTRRLTMTKGLTAWYSPHLHAKVRILHHHAHFAISVHKPTFLRRMHPSFCLEKTDQIGGIRQFGIFTSLNLLAKEGAS